MSDDTRSMELKPSEYLVDDGVENILELIRKRLNIRDLDLETEVFQTYFKGLMRKRGETSTKHIHAEEAAYRTFQRVLKEAMDGEHDEYSEDESGWYDPKKFQIPKRLRGWLCMERAQLPSK